jgi:predicted metal-dependent enzyme (double-stranded beta helix superfamily)
VPATAHSFESSLFRTPYSAPPRTPTPGGIVARLLRSREPWAQHARFDADRRWYAKIGEHDGHEVWLLSWLPGQGTDLHDHGDSSGAFGVVSGRLTELTIERRSPGPRTETFLWTPAAVRPFGPGHVHQVTNTSGSRAVSLHVYSLSLTRMTRYRLAADGLETLGVDRAGVAW